MTRGGLTMQQALRLQDIKPGAPGPVTDDATIAALIDIAGVLLATDYESGVFTFDQVAAEVRSLLSDGQTISDEDLRRILPANAFTIVLGGYRFR